MNRIQHRRSKPVVHFLVAASTLVICCAALGQTEGPAIVDLKKAQGQAQVWVESSLVRIFPKSDPGTSTSRTLVAARNKKLSFQVGIRNGTQRVTTVECLTTAPEDIGVMVRRVGYVPMRHLTPGTRPEELDGLDYLPGLVPDPLFPETKSNLGPLEAQSFWITVDVPTTATPGSYEIPLSVVFTAEKTAVPLSVAVSVHEFTIKDRQDFPVTHWWRPSSIWGHYKLVPWSDEWFAMTEKYVRNMVEHGSNVLLVNTLEFRRELFKQPNQMLKITKEGDKYSFDYSVVKRFVDMAKQCGVEYFEWPHLWLYWGVNNPMPVYKDPGKSSELFFSTDGGGFSPEYIDFLKQYLESLHAFLQQECIL